MAGLYETALETLCCREIDGKRLPPELVAAAATVRRAQSQIQALFDRSRTAIFPPPGPDRGDSFDLADIAVAVERHSEALTASGHLRHLALTRS